jgi:hypothetical protein
MTFRVLLSLSRLRDTAAGQTVFSQEPSKEEFK